ncbi:MAG: thiol reductant ABC exporter subunit CydC [Eggerthellaceae bacterium]|jgi:ATP-binding cassette subfamily C protein CydC
MTSETARTRTRDRWVRPYFAKYRKPLALALVLGLATFACSALLMFTSGYLISGTAECPEVGLIAVYYPIVFVQVFGLGKPVARYLERLYSHDWVFRMTSSLRVRLYRIVEANGRSRSMGDFLGLVADDIGHLQNLYLRTVFPAVIAWLLYAAVIVALGCFDMRFALVMLLVLGVTVFLMPLVSLLANRARMERRKAGTDRLYRTLTDNVLGADDWVFSGRGAEYAERAASQAAHVREQRSALDRYARWNDLVASAVFAAGACLTLLWAGGTFGGQPGGAADWIAAFALGYFPLIDAFAPLSFAAAEANGHRASIVRLNALPEDGDTDAVEAEGNDEGAPADSGSTGAEGSFGTASALPAAVPVHVHRVAYAYPTGTHRVLDGVELDIPAGQHVAVLGRSGSGKSTLAMLLRGGDAPDEGTVTVGGRHPSDLGETAARYLGFVQQQPYLFNRTLRDNLLIARPGATDEQLQAALRDVGLKGLLARLPHGLDTLVDEAGTRFSGGERHRIALARVLLADTPAVLLDEPTVGLDPITEQALMDTLMEAFANKTLIMITHHLQGIEAFDRVVFLEDGRIVLDGSPQKLARTSDRYRRLLSFDRGK